MRQAKLSDNEEYFPYTHGDLIEEQRLIMNSYMASELKDAYQEAIRWKQDEFSRKARSVDKYKDENWKQLLSRHGIMYGFSD